MASTSEERLNFINSKLTNTTTPTRSVADGYELATDAKDSFSIIKALKESCGFTWMMDRCGVDHLEDETESKRFEVVTHLYAPDTNERIRIKTFTDEKESVPTLIPLWRGANWFERETWDMYGIEFSGHPDLERILTHHEFQGYPLRKDYNPENYQELSEPLPIHFDDDPSLEDEDPLEANQWINIGPSHPATHGTLRIMAEVNGEIIKRTNLEIGYMHRCFEKMGETHKWNQIIPYTDRLNYCSSAMNNVGYCRAIEQMIGVEVPEAGQALRMILSEFSRIMDHFVCVGTNAVDIGALTTFWYSFAPREKIYELLEEYCGARLTVSLTRVGGMAYDLPEGWLKRAEEAVTYIEKQMKLVDGLLTKNPIWISRTKGVCALDQESSIQYGYTGPLLRATGLNFDLRKVEPYYFYDQVEFDIPIALNGDVYDRYLVRMEEIHQSCRIIRQLLKNFPTGPMSIDDKRITLPKKEDVYNSIEGLMNHFMLVIHDVQVPKGEYYSFTEAANGELGFYCVSNGSGWPTRIRCRGPSFAHYQAFPEMIEGKMIADAVAGLGSINIIAGELDR